VTEAQTDTVAVVVVTYNRAALLTRMLAGLAALDRRPDAVIVVDNASTDHTTTVLEGARHSGDLPLQVIRPEENLGGAGGFHLGMKAAHEQGYDRIWLMDDDVVPAPDCLSALLAVDAEHADCLMAVREDTRGRLADRAAMPALVEIENVAFEGFLVRRRVIDAIGLPDPTFFIFYDDVDYALRARRAGYRIWAVRDAVLVRQLDFDQQHDLSGWKGYYMYRNLFAVHRRYGANPFVRAKPYLVTAAVVVLSPVRGGRAEAKNVIHAMRDARGMTEPSLVSVD